MRKLLAAAGVIAAVAAATAANAVVVPFGGTASGADPLGQAWSTSNTFAPSWGEPGLGAGVLTFNPGNFSNSHGTWANEFDFIFLKGVTGAIDQTPSSGPFGFDFTTRFTDVTTGQAWTPHFVGSQEVDFIAPTGSKISAGDQFFVNVAFTGPVNLDHFSFAGLWTDAGVPEPGAWALMITGLGLLGATMRRRQVAVAA